MEEQGFLQALAKTPNDPELLLVYADWLEEQGRDDDALAIRMKRLAGVELDAFTRASVEGVPGYNARVARKWFTAYPQLRVVLVGYATITTTGMQYMPLGKPGWHRRTTPASDDPTSAVLYHRKGKGYRANLVAFVQVPATFN